MTVMMMLAAAVLAQDAPQVASRAELIAGHISAEDYPAEARSAREEGVVRIRFEVNEDGAVTDCTVVGSSGSESLDSASCALVSQRFRFAPAKDAEGRAIAETRTQSIRWALPIQTTSDGGPLLRVVVDREILPPTCRVTSGGELIMLSAELCERLADGQPSSGGDTPISIKATDLPGLLSRGFATVVPSGNHPPVRAELTDGYISVEDYPAAALRQRQEGAAVIRFRIDTEGRVRDCTVAISSGFPLLDRASCRLTEQRFRFRPAQDADGSPTEDERLQTVGWEMAPVSR